MRNINKLSSGYEVIEFEELDYTMTMMKEMVLAGCNIKTVVRAKRQISGRGRHGRVWESPLGNLYFSFLRQSEENNRNLFAPVFIAALSVAHTIIYVTKNKLIPSIKWPNDILINKSKIAGILIENITIPDKADILNICIGINIISHPNLKNTYLASNILEETRKQPTAKEIIHLLKESYENFFDNLKEYSYINFKKKMEIISIK